MSRRAALSINCSESQAIRVRENAERERRTISGYVLNVTLRAVIIQEKYFSRIARLMPYPVVRPPGPRTCLLVRCSAEEAKRIRTAAKLRQMTMCSYVLHCLERSWHGQGAVVDLLRALEGQPEISGEPG